ncbi:MAG: AAA family ATPase [Nakamurella sp.]
MTKTMTHMRVIAAGIRANVPTLIWGDPGVGKTATMTDHGQKWGFHVETVVGSIREATDFNGLPIVDGKVVEYTTQGWAERCADADKALLFFDELTTAPPSVQRAMLRVLQERFVGDFKLPDTVSIIAAANPPSVAVDGWDLPAPIANRLMHVDWKFDSEAWLTGVLTDFQGTDPESLEVILGRADDTHKIKVRAQVTSFLRHTNLTHEMPTNATAAGKGWPSPRSWTNAMSVLGELRADDEDAILVALIGCVGEKAAIEYVRWVESSDLYDPDAVLADPSIVDWRHPRVDRLYSLIYSIAALTQSRPPTSKGWLAAVAVLEAAANGGRPDVAAPAVKMVLRAKPRNVDVPETLRAAFTDLFAATGRWAA